MANVFDTEQHIREFYDEHPDALDKYIEDLYEIDMSGKVFDIPYWCEQYRLDDIEYKAQYIPGFWEDKRYGDEIVIDDLLYRYHDSVPLSEEIEMYDENNKEFYIYTGHSYLRILEPINKLELQDE